MGGGLGEDVRSAVRNDTVRGTKASPAGHLPLGREAPPSSPEPHRAGFVRELREHLLLSSESDTDSYRLATTRAGAEQQQAAG
jgi:hypothetical protein